MSSRDSVSKKSKSHKNLIADNFPSPARASDVAPRTTAPSSSFTTLRVTTLILLPLLSFLGFFGTWHLSGSNGTFQTLFDAISARSPKFPGTNEDLLTTYTGLAPLDEQLKVLVAFFAPVVDGKSDVLSLHSVFGLGQFGAGWTLMMLESFREGNQGRLVSWVGTVGVIFQNITFAVAVPLWFLLHLVTSPVSKSFAASQPSRVLLVSSLDLKLLPLSVILGYGVPSWLMSLKAPDTVSVLTHQKLIALWQPFPVWTVLVQLTLRTIFQSIGTASTSAESKKSVALQDTSYLDNVKQVYGFILSLCMVTHIPILLIALTPSSILNEFVPRLAKFANLNFFDVYIPYFPFTDYKVSSLAAGIHSFLQWDVNVGSIAFVLWAVVLHRAATTSLSKDREAQAEDYLTNGQLLGKVLLWTVLAGPVGAATALLWDRDMVVKRKVKQGI